MVAGGASRAVGAEVEEDEDEEEEGAVDSEFIQAAMDGDLDKVKLVISEGASGARQWLRAYLRYSLTQLHDWYLAAVAGRSSTGAVQSMLQR